MFKNKKKFCSRTKRTTKFHNVYSIFRSFYISLYIVLYHVYIVLFGKAYSVCWNKRPPKTVIFQRKEYTKPMALDGWCFQRGEYTKPMALDGWFFKGGSTQNRWLWMGDFSKGGVHKTDGSWWVSFQRGEYTKPMGFGGWFFKGGSTQNRWVLMGEFSKGRVHKTDGFGWVIFQRGEYTKPMGLGILVIASKNWAPGTFISASTVYVCYIVIHGSNGFVDSAIWARLTRSTIWRCRVILVVCWIGFWWGMCRRANGSLSMCGKRISDECSFWSWISWRTVCDTRSIVPSTRM